MGKQDPQTGAAARPLRGLAETALLARFGEALARRDGAGGAHCVHELWMRGAMAAQVEPMLERLWQSAAETIPDWLPMHFVEWLPLAYEIAGRCRAAAGGRSHLYLVLLDYRDSRDEPWGIYVGVSRYPAAQRFDQHKAGIKAAGSVLKRGLEPLTGPVAHLQYIARAEALRIESELAEALRAVGLFVKGGH